MTKLQHLLFFIGQIFVRIGAGFFGAQYYLNLNHNAHTPNDHQPTTRLESGEKADRTTVTNPKAEQVNNSLDQLVETMKETTPEHFAASLNETQAKAKYAELCSVYSTVCSSTFRDGSYNRSDKYLYQGLSIALINQLDKRLLHQSKLNSTLSQLKIYQNSEERRGSAGHTTIKINSEKIPTGREYREVLTHELGHVVDLGIVVGNKRTKNKAFTEFGKVIRAEDDPSLGFYQLSWLSEYTRKKEASYKDFVSGYAMKGIYEDFAETQNLRFNHNLLFQELAKTNPVISQKYNYFKQLYGNSRFDDNTDTVVKAKDSQRPRDTTRIATP